MYPSEVTAENVLDHLAPDTFKYTIKTQQYYRSLPPKIPYKSCTSKLNPPNNKLLTPFYKNASIGDDRTADHADDKGTLDLTGH